MRTLPRQPSTGRGARSSLLAIACAASLLAEAIPQGYPLWESTGLAPNWRHGTSVSATGDLDGDGLGDLFVGAGDGGGPLFPPQEARVLSGATGTLLFSFTSTLTASSFGSAVSGVGDTNGDGMRDLLVGAPGNVLPQPFADPGRVILFSGATGLQLLQIQGSVAGGFFGWSVAGVGDQNLDGYADVLVGSPGESAFGGAARIYSGFTGAVLLPLTGTWPGGRFGTSVSEIGDLDGDAVPDVIVGAPLADPAGLANAGEARVFSAASGGVLYTIAGPAAGDLLGSSVAGPLDATGDGLADILVGAPQSSELAPGIAGPGYAVLLSGATGAAVLTLTGGALGDRFGFSVAWTGDVDGDGLSDFAVGAPGVDGSVLPDNGRATVYSGTTGAPLLVHDGSPVYTQTGWAVAGVGDASGDGIFDVAVGAPSSDAPSGTDAGRMRLLSPVGIPSGSVSFGAGCAGTGGIAPSAATYGGLPTTGNVDFGLSISRGMGGSIAFLFASTAVDPAGISLGGCSVHLAGSILFLPPVSLLPGPPGVPGAGFRLRNLSVPPIPALVGAAVPFQWAIVDGGSPNGLFTTSNAVAVAIL